MRRPRVPPTIKTCPTCGRKSLRSVREDVRFSSGRTFRDVPHLVCTATACGERLFDHDSLLVIEEQRPELRRRQLLRRLAENEAAEQEAHAGMHRSSGAWRTPKRLPVLYRCDRAGVLHSLALATRAHDRDARFGHDIITHSGPLSAREQQRATASTLRDRSGKTGRERAETRALETWFLRVERNGYRLSEEDAYAARYIDRRPTPAQKLAAVEAARDLYLAPITVRDGRQWSTRCPALSAVGVGCYGLGRTRDAATRDWHDAVAEMAASLEEEVRRLARASERSVGLHEVLGRVASLSQGGDTIVPIADVVAAFGPPQRRLIQGALMILAHQGAVTRMVDDQPWQPGELPDGVRLTSRLATAVRVADAGIDLDQALSVVVSATEVRGQWIPFSDVAAALGITKQQAVSALRALGHAGWLEALPSQGARLGRDLAQLVGSSWHEHAFAETCADEVMGRFDAGATDSGAIVVLDVGRGEIVRRCGSREEAVAAAREAAEHFDRRARGR